MTDAERDGAQHEDRTPTMIEVTPMRRHLNADDQTARLNARRILGPRATATVDSSNRTAARAWLRGLGFDSREVNGGGDAKGFTVATLAAAYQSDSYLRAMVEKRGAAWTDVAAALADDERRLSGMPTDRAPQTDNPLMTETDMPILTLETEQEPRPMKRQPAADAPTLPGLDESELAVIEALRKARTPALDEDRVISLIKTHAGRPATVRLEITRDGAELPKAEGAMHHMFPALLAGVSAGVPIMLVGPAGSGKTTAAAKVAEALGLPFAYTGAVSSEYKLSGFVDAQGRITHTPFRTTYAEGGVFLMDEMDGSAAAAILAFNGPIANDEADFPGGMVRKHKDFRVIAAANTYGRGADRQYVGRSQLDAATLDRYAVMTWDYDPCLESAIMGLPAPKGAPEPVRIDPVTRETDRQALAADWMARVLSIRNAVDKLNEGDDRTKAIRLIVSPRATVNGWKLQCAGWSRTLTEEAVIWRGIDRAARAKIEAAA